MPPASLDAIAPPRSVRVPRPETRRMPQRDPRWSTLVHTLTDVRQARARLHDLDLGAVTRTWT